MKKNNINKKGCKKGCKSAKKVAKKGCKLGVLHPKLTKSEADVLYLITEEFLTVKKAAIRRKCTTQTIYKIMRNLKEKGYLKQGLQKVANFDHPLQPNGCRLHAEVFRIIILDKPDNFKDLIGKRISIGGNTVQIHKEVVMVYSNQSFFGTDSTDSTAKACKYWDRFFLRLENDLKINLVKPRVQNIERKRAEYANIHNGLAKKCEKEGEKIRIRTSDDGKVWFEIDNSFNLREAETKHPETSQEDMQETIEPFFNDLRRLKITPQQLINMIATTQQQINNLAQGQINTNTQLQNVITLITPKEPKIEDKVKDSRVSYIG